MAEKKRNVSGSSTDLVQMMRRESQKSKGSKRRLVEAKEKAIKEEGNKTPLYLSAEFEVDSIDVVSQVFKCSGWMAFFWEKRDGIDDEFLDMEDDTPTARSSVHAPLVPSTSKAGGLSNYMQMRKQFPVNPKVLFDNGINHQITHGPKWRYNPDNNLITWKFQFQVDLTERMELHRFPFDRQHLHALLNIRTSYWKLLLQPPGHWITEDVAVEWAKYYYDYPCVFRIAESVSGWRPRSPIVDYRLSPPGLPQERTKLATGVPTFIMRVERESGYYMSNIVLPLFLIVGTSIMSFAIDTGLGERLQVTLTLLLTVVAFKFVIQDDLPQVAYLTYLDSYVILSYLVLVLVALENTLENLIDQDNRDDLDRWSAIVFGGFWFVLHVYIYLGSRFNWFRVPWAELHLHQRSFMLHRRMTVNRDKHMFSGYVEEDQAT